MGKNKPFYYGGQALIEGVMMNGPVGYAMAARTESGDILYKVDSRKTLKERFPVLGLPIIRGLVGFVESMKVGFGCLSWSAMQAGESDEDKLSMKEVVFTVILALVISVLFFVVLPVAAANFTVQYLGYFGRSVVEGLLRIGLFLAYILLIRRMSDIKRVFQYHGAEHKTINTLEAGEALTVANVRKHSTINPRCGTSFVLMAMILMIVVFTFVGNTTIAGRILTKIVMMPIVVGIAYEIYRLPLAFPKNRLIKILVAPGLAMQKLTTAEPEDDQLEVAIASLMMVPGFPAPAGSELPPRLYKENDLPQTATEGENI